MFTQHDQINPILNNFEQEFWINLEPICNTYSVRCIQRCWNVPNTLVNSIAIYVQIYIYIYNIESYGDVKYVEFNYLYNPNYALSRGRII